MRLSRDGADLLASLTHTEGKTNMRRPSLFLLGLAAVAVGGLLVGASACGGSTGGGAEPGCYDYESFDGKSTTVAFKADVLPILRRSCGLSSSCHSSESGPPGQHFYGIATSAGEMTDAQIKTIFDQSVGAAATAEPEMKVVAAGDPEHSFLMYKLDGDPMAALDAQLTCATLKCVADKSCLSSMPQGGPQLPAEERDTIRRWIAQGAKND